jgi:hypothetical protein
MENYDSRTDTLKHKLNVQELITTFCEEMEVRAKNHDNSKLEEPEKSVFDKMTPKLKKLTYGSNEYKQSLEELGVALTHHYENNSHHPEHNAFGINGMSLFDIVEMFYDWVAASSRISNGCIFKSIEINKKRFNLSDQLCEIFKNTADEMGLEPRE